MAELLIRVKDKVSEDPYVNARLTKRGDVIVVCPDGWMWGKQELANPEWLIVRVPGMSVSEADIFTMPEIVTSQTHLAMRQPRHFYVDLDSLPVKASLTAAELKDAARIRPSLEDPRIFGGDMRVFG